MQFTKLQKKILVFCVLGVVFSLGAAIYALAAFLGKGSSKGVLIGSEYFFESDVLNGVETIAAVEDVEIKCTTGTQMIQIRNFDYSSGTANNFDVTYQIKCWLTQPVMANDPYDYYILIDGVKTKLQSLNESNIMADATLERPYVTANYVLPGGAMQTKNFSVIYERKETASDSAVPMNTIGVYVEPLSPNYMKSLTLGGTVVMTNSRFGVTGVFDSFDDINEEAGFLYRITTSGIASAEQTVTMTWDSSKLELDYDSVLAGQTVTTTAYGSEDQVLDLAANPDAEVAYTRSAITYYPQGTPGDESGETLYFMNLAFYRTGDDYWTQTRTWENISELVTVTADESIE